MSSTNFNLLQQIHSPVLQPSYGVKSRGCQLDANEVAKIILSKFDENDLIQHMMKVLFGCGLYAAFRGSAEHTYFSRTQVKFGTYPPNFENPNLARKRYVAIDNMPKDKTSTLGVNNSYARELGNTMRFPIIDGDMNNFGGSLERLIEKMSPGQVRIYCRPAGRDRLLEMRNAGFKNAMFYAASQIGEKMILQMFKDGAELLGLTNARHFKPHSLRGACITILANDPSVSLAETMKIARHTSVSASKVYQRVDGISEGNRLVALGQ